VKREKEKYKMNTQDLFIKAATYQYPEQIPVSVGILPAVFIKYGGEIKAVIAEYPEICGEWWQNYNPYENMPGSYREGQFTDAWGCVWSNKADGLESIVTEHPVKTREDVYGMKIPEKDVGIPHGFMYLRLLDLRGFEEMMVDFFEEPPELQILIDKVLNYNLRQVKVMLENNKSQMVYFGDDLGMQKGLAIGADRWRKYMKPCFEAIYKLCKDDNRLIYMHTDGCIYEIMEDLRECGVDMINPQYRANGLDNLVRICKGKIPICLDLDRQLFPVGTPDDMRRHVEGCVKALYLPEGGFALNLEIGPDNPPENINALLSEINELRFYKG
jgi:hypothetical protein